MNEPTDIDALRAYKLTLKGILVTFVICNVLIIAAVGVGFRYTIKRIDETARNADEKIDKTYAALADYSKKLNARLQAIGEKAEIAASNASEVVGGAIGGAKQELKEDAKELKEKGKQAIIDYLKKKAEKSDQ